MSEWISVEDRLPEHKELWKGQPSGCSDWVLATDGKHVAEMFYHYVPGGFCGGFWSSCDGMADEIESEHVTHWMPLPEPPPKVSGILMKGPQELANDAVAAEAAQIEAQIAGGLYPTPNDTPGSKEGGK